MSTQTDDTRWIDKHGDIWTLGNDGLLHTPETAPFPRDHVEKKWGPLKPLKTVSELVAGEHDHCPTCDSCTPVTRNLRASDNQPCADPWHTTPPISDEAVEEAAAATYTFVTGIAWSQIDPASEAAEAARREARAALEAAYPLIRQQVAEEIAKAIAQAGDERSKHRSHERASVSRLGSVRHTSYLDAAKIAREIGGRA